jgi:hypothetical protein
MGRRAGRLIARTLTESAYDGPPPDITSKRQICEKYLNKHLLIANSSDAVSAISCNDSYQKDYYPLDGRVKLGRSWPRGWKFDDGGRA